MEVKLFIQKIIEQSFELLEKMDAINALELLLTNKHHVDNLNKNDILVLYYNVNIASALLNLGNFKACMIVCDNMILHPSFKKDIRITGMVYQIYANSLINTGKYNLAIQNLNLSLKFLSRCTAYKDLVKSKLLYGDVLFRKGLWIEAIDIISSALLIAKKYNCKISEANSLIDLAYVFRAHSFYYLSIDLYREAERLYNEESYIPGIVESKYQRANSYISTKNIKSALELISEIKSLVPYEKSIMNFVNRLLICISNQNENFDESMVLANELLLFFERAGDKRGIAEAYETIGSIFFNICKFEDAILFGEKSYAIANEINDYIYKNKSRELIESSRLRLTYSNM